MKRLTAWLMLMMCLVPHMARAEAFELDDDVYRLLSEDGTHITSRAGRIYVDDEYISSDNELYRVTQVDDELHTATAAHIGPEPVSSDAVQASANEAAKGTICMYSTHSDESYIDGDGAQSKTEGAGIYDIGDALKENLENLGWTVEYNKETSLPHDAGAYRRSRSIAQDLVKQRPAALLDLHRDGIPDPEEYETEVDGESMTKVRLLVGRSNPNSDANRELAKRIKARADEDHPGLIKDIFIGKGNYNQELYPKSLLLEFGTHTSDKDEVKKSTSIMAETLSAALGGGTAKADDAANAGANRAGGTGILWLIGIAVVAAVGYALVQTGTISDWKAKLARGTSEITGGLLGGKPGSSDDDKPDR